MLRHPFLEPDSKTIGRRFPAPYWHHPFFADILYGHRMKKQNIRGWNGALKTDERTTRNKNSRLAATVHLGRGPDSRTYPME